MATLLLRNAPGAEPLYNARCAAESSCRRRCSFAQRIPQSDLARIAVPLVDGIEHLHIQHGVQKLHTNVLPILKPAEVPFCDADRAGLP